MTRDKGKGTTFAITIANGIVFAVGNGNGKNKALRVAVTLFDGIFSEIYKMNNKLAKKMTTISGHFEKAGVSLPIAAQRTDIKSVRYDGKNGVTVEGRAIWGVTPREYWKFCKAQAI